ncbi:MAG: DJ-1/PfpI family protein [Candidatus Marinimicrobia bacterium]|nr:DJ-1/PfpI family protein [Candidatus Neomarinimicrobiota bacterium]
MPKVLVPIAEGFEEIEAITIIDILRRAGAKVVVAGLGKKLVEGSHGITVQADQTIEQVNPDGFDMIVLPGGMPGMVNLKQSEKIIDLLRRLSESKKYTAAVCASPVVLEEAGIISSKKVACHPNNAASIKSGEYTGSRVEVDGRVITGQAAGSAMEFAFKLVEVLFGKEKVEEINQGVLALL